MENVKHRNANFELSQNLTNQVTCLMLSTADLLSIPDIYNLLHDTKI